VHIPHFSKPAFVLILIAVILLGIGLFNFLVIKYSGTPVAAPDIPRGAEQYGSGKSLTYVVLGDSTTISQGGDYDKGYVRASARFLAAKGYKVTLHNFGVSGARTHDVLTKQVPQAIQVQPDIVLIVVGANDVTHLTSVASIKRDLGDSIDKIQGTYSNTKILITGSPQMGTIPRFPQPARALAKWRTDQINTMAQALADDRGVTFVPIADKTGPIFAAHPELYAKDKFHPTTEGYAVWIPVVNSSLDQALTSKN
jgi:acyl-CoA thioesterase I